MERIPVHPWLSTGAISAPAPGAHLFIIIIFVLYHFWLCFHHGAVAELGLQSAAGWKELLECLRAFAGMGEAELCAPGTSQLSSPGKGHKPPPMAQNSQTASFLW